MGTYAFITQDESIRTTAAAYLLAVSQVALRDFARERGVDAGTLLALQREAVTLWAEKWGCDMVAVESQEILAAHHLGTAGFAPITAPDKTLHA